MRLATLLITSLALLTCGPAAAATQAGGGELALDPPNVAIDLRFGGADIVVRATLPDAGEAVVVLAAPPGRLELKRIGKRGGLLWMGVGEVVFDDVPGVYQVLTTGPLSSIASPAARARWRLGYEQFSPDRDVGSGVRRELVGLKEHEGLFAIREGGLERAAAAQGGARSGLRLRGAFRLPAATPAGTYSVELLGFRNGEGTRLASLSLPVEHVGAARALRRLAFDHGLAYGMTASIVAIVVGLLTGLLFRTNSDEGH